MDKFVLLICTLNTIHSTHAKPKPFTFYHKNYTTFKIQGNFMAPTHITMMEPIIRPTNENIPLSKLVFPESHVTQTRSTANNTDRNCISGFCEITDEYPEEYIKNFLNRTRLYDNFFRPIVPEITDRINGEEINLCRSTKNTTYPRTGFNSNKVKRRIANVDGYKQGIVMEMCSEHAECEFSDIWPSGYTSLCKQKYTELNLLVMENDGQFVIDTFTAPSCCSCMYVKVF